MTSQRLLPNSRAVLLSALPLRMKDLVVNMKKTRITAYVPEALQRELFIVTRDLGQSQSEFVTDAITQYLALLGRLREDAGFEGLDESWDVREILDERILISRPHVPGLMTSVEMEQKRARITEFHQMIDDVVARVRSRSINTDEERTLTVDRSLTNQRDEEVDDAGDIWMPEDR